MVDMVGGGKAIILPSKGERTVVYMNGIPPSSLK